MELKARELTRSMPHPENLVTYVVHLPADLAEEMEDLACSIAGSPDPILARRAFIKRAVAQAIVDTNEALTGGDSSLMPPWGTDDTPRKGTKYVHRNVRLPCGLRDEMLDAINALSAAQGSEVSIRSFLEAAVDVACFDAQLRETHQDEGNQGM